MRELDQRTEGESSQGGAVVKDMGWQRAWGRLTVVGRRYYRVLEGVLALFYRKQSICIFSYSFGVLI
jgi:hypothetical protein